VYLNEVKLGAVYRYGIIYRKVIGFREHNGEIYLELHDGSNTIIVSPKEIFPLTSIERGEGPEIRSIFEVEIAETVAKQLASSGHLDREV